MRLSKKMHQALKYLLASYPVENEIHYGDLTEYQLGLAPKIYIQLSDLIKKNPGATTDKEMDKTFAGIKGIGPARAKKIYETFKAKGTDYKWKG